MKAVGGPPHSVWLQIQLALLGNMLRQTQRDRSPLSCLSSQGSEACLDLKTVNTGVLVAGMSDVEKTMTQALLQHKALCPC